MKTRNLYTVYEMTPNKKTALQNFKNRKIKGAVILNTQPKKGWTQIEFIKKRK